MVPEYDIFEQLPDGDVEWHGIAIGLEAALSRLNLLAKRSRNEFFATHISTKEIVARANRVKAVTGNSGT